MIYIRSLLFNFLFFIYLHFIMILALPILCLNRSYTFRLAHAWSAGSLFLLKHIVGLECEFRGLENIPKGPCIIAAKHQSVWETFALTMFFNDFTFILKRELTWIPLFGYYLLKSEQIAINRSRGRESLKEIGQKSKAILNAGRQLIIFPEGTRRAAGAPPDYKSGAAFIYAQNNAPCVPVALNSGLFWPRRTFVKRRGKIIAEFLPVIPAGLKRDKFEMQLEQAIETHTDALMKESLAQFPEARINYVG
jgi:1-acyl-sn-glycerol-3-phosphate acyltransferase